MDFTVEKSDFLRCLYLAQGVVARRNSLPILSHVLISSTSDDRINITATDLEIGLTQTCLAKVKEQGQLSTGAQRLHAIVKELPSGEMSVKSTSIDYCHIKSNKSKLKVLCLDPGQFPELAWSQDAKTRESIPSIAFEGGVFGEMIEKTAFAAASDETRLNLRGVYVEALDSGKIRMASSDGHRLALVDREVAIPDLATWPKVLLPHKGLLEAKRLVDRDSGVVRFMSHDSFAGVEGVAGDLSMRLIEGEFPDYKKIVPSDCAVSASVDVNLLVASLRRLQALIDGNKRGISIKLMPELMEILYNSDSGSGTEELPCEYRGEEVSVGLDVKYLLDFLNVVGSGQVKMEFQTPENPILFTPANDPDFRYVLMPLRIS